MIQIFARRARKLGISGMRFHDLRASRGTLLLDRGIGVHTVAERLGHDVERLMMFLTALDQDVEIVIRNKPRSRMAGRISVVAA